MERVFLPIYLVLFIGALYLNKYLEKHGYLERPTFKLLRKIAIVIGIICFIITIFTLFFSFSFEKDKYGLAIDYINYSKLHNYSKGKSQKIALIDSGISKFQIEKDNKNTVSLTGGIYDVNGHGTMMYSIIKGYKNDIYGIAPDAEVLSIKVMGTEEKISPSVIADAINLAISKKCTIRLWAGKAR